MSGNTENTNKNHTKSSSSCELSGFFFGRLFLSFVFFLIFGFIKMRMIHWNWVNFVAQICSFLFTFLAGKCVHLIGILLWKNAGLRCQSHWKVWTVWSEHFKKEIRCWHFPVFELVRWYQYQFVSLRMCFDCTIMSNLFTYAFNRKYFSACNWDTEIMNTCVQLNEYRAGWYEQIDCID